MNNKEIESFFLTNKYLECNSQNILEIILQYINNKPLYLNEIRNYLHKNDKILYEKYANCFKHNQGREMVFKIPFVNTNSKNFVHIKKFETYKPVIKDSAENNNIKNTKIKTFKIKKLNKNENKFRSKKYREEKIINEKKIQEIHRKIRKN